MNWKLKLVNIVSKFFILIVGLLCSILGSICTWYGLTTLNTGPEVTWTKLTSSFLLLSLLIYGLLLLTTGSLSLLSVYSSSNRFWKLFLFFVIMALCVQLGAWSTFKMQSVSENEFVEQIWSEMNQNTRNNIQREFECCGLTGLSEFAQKLDPVDISCYREGKLVRSGCKKPLVSWIHDHRQAFNKLSLWTTILQSLSVFSALIWLRNIAPYRERKSLSNGFPSNDQILLTEPSL